MKKLFKQSVSSQVNTFTSWIVQRVKHLNGQVDADVFAAFIEGVDSPDEVWRFLSLFLSFSHAFYYFLLLFIIVIIYCCFFELLFEWSLNLCPWWTDSAK
ncbi:unnamed protein product [Anisakis simplex]|uniref:Uncharacterized protein n=1 Tax=Anisakis simplex TaxID=6269 RepID=A0A0M3JN91_ANISI|nr:unnamed protein product [Anisakis simplex]